jgi:hypothetical protein
MATGYGYRKTVSLSGTAGAGTGYQVMLKVGESSGSTGANFHLENHCINFPTDIRFTSADGLTDLDYFIENVTGSAPNRIAQVWVEVQANLNTAQDIRVYYKKTGDTSASSLDNTFTLNAEDDMPNGSWETDTGSWILGAGVSRSNDRAHAGSYSMKMTTANSNAYNQPGWGQYNTLTTGKLALLTGWAYATVANNALIQIAVGSSHGRTDDNVALASAYHTGSSTWEKLAVLQVVNVPVQGAPWSSTNIGATASTVYHDDLALKVTTRPVVSPNPTYSSAAAEVAILTGYPNLLLLGVG